MKRNRPRQIIEAVKSSNMTAALQSVALVTVQALVLLAMVSLLAGCPEIESGTDSATSSTLSAPELLVLDR